MVLGALSGLSKTFAGTYLKNTWRRMTDAIASREEDKKKLISKGNTDRGTSSCCSVVNNRLRIRLTLMTNFSECNRKAMVAIATSDVVCGVLSNGTNLSTQRNFQVVVLHLQLCDSYRL